MENDTVQNFDILQFPGEREKNNAIFWSDYVIRTAGLKSFDRSLESKKVTSLVRERERERERERKGGMVEENEEEYILGLTCIFLYNI